MKFFMPQAERSNTEASYQAILASLKSQLGWKITDRRIYSLHYLHDKKEHSLQVGELEPQERRYQVMAIFESNAYIVFTRTPDGYSGTTILVDKTEVLAAVDFDPVKVR